MRRILLFVAEECRIGTLLVLAGLFGCTAYGQSDPYGAPGSPGPQGQYGQQSQYDADDWNDEDDWYDRQSYDGYDSYRGQAPSIDVGFFYGELSPYGEWVRHPYYGWVWFPRHVHAGWRPYSVGRWVESDYGWTWVSYEPFGWATYHYGRWAWDRWVGWLWVPGTDWAPAWVAWQQGNGYIGWAPLPPAVGFDMRVGIQLGGFSLSFGIAPRNYAFVEERRFLDSRIDGYIVPEARNITIINQTTNVTNYTVVNNKVINHGVPVERVERATGRRAQRLRVAAAPSARAAGVQRDVVQVYRPPESKLESVKVARRNNAGLRQAERKAARQEERKAERQEERKAARAEAQAEKAKPDAKTPVRKESGPVPIPVAPRAQPAPRTNNERQFAREQENLRRNLEKERRTLEQMQQQEKAQAQAKADAKAVAERHAAEMKAQQERRQRAEQQLKTRQQIERQAAQASAGAARKDQRSQAGGGNAKQQEKKQAEGQKAKKTKKQKQDEKDKPGDEPKPPQ